MWGHRMWVILINLSTLESWLEIMKHVEGVRSFFLRLETSSMTAPWFVKSSLMAYFGIFVRRCFTTNFMFYGAEPFCCIDVIEYGVFIQYTLGNGEIFGISSFNKGMERNLN